MDRVHDVSSFDFSKAEELSIALDTNVLVAMFYGMDIDASKIHQREYTDALEAIAINNRYVKLYTTAINISEAFAVIERIEFDIFKEINDKEISLKEFRLNEKSRARVKKALVTFWEQALHYLNVSDVELTKKFVKQYKTKFDKYRYDCMDAVLVKYCIDNDIKYIMTDDSDFAGYEQGIDIITANQYVLRKYRLS